MTLQTPKPWKYELSDCDVLDQEKLKVYRKVAAGWHHLLRGDDTHSIWNQVSNLLWQDAAWRVANEARRWEHEDGPTAAVSPIIANLLDQGYMSGQIIGISKLIENSDAKKPRRGIISLRRLVDEINGNRELFTREIFVSHDGLPYNWESVWQSEISSSLTSISGQSGGWLSTEGPTAWSSSRSRHETFDALSNTQESNRSRSDVIRSDIFIRLTDNINNPLLDQIRNLRNKYFVHAADVFSRSQGESVRQSLKLDEFSQAHRCLLGTTQAISAGLLFHDWRANAIPTSQYNKFAHLEKCFVREKRIAELKSFWDAYSASKDEQMKAAYHEIIPE